MSTLLPSELIGLVPQLPAGSAPSTPPSSSFTRLLSEQGFTVHHHVADIQTLDNHGEATVPIRRQGRHRWLLGQVRRTFAKHQAAVKSAHIISKVFLFDCDGMHKSCCK